MTETLLSLAPILNAAIVIIAIIGAIKIYKKFSTTTQSSSSEEKSKEQRHTLSRTASFSSKYFISGIFLVLMTSVWPSLLLFATGHYIGILIWGFNVIVGTSYLEYVANKSALRKYNSTVLILLGLATLVVGIGPVNLVARCDGNVIGFGLFLTPMFLIFPYAFVAGIHKKACNVTETIYNFPHNSNILLILFMAAAIGFNVYPTAQQKNLDEKLSEAIQQGDLDFLEKYLNQSYGKNRQYKTGETILCNAASAGRIEVMDFLLKKGVKVNSLDGTFGWTPLMYAAKDLKTTQYLVEHGADVNFAAKKSEGRALIAASGHLEIVQYLISHGAKVDARGYKGTTALMEVARTQNLEIAKLLVDQGANVNLHDDMGYTALIYSITSFRKHSPGERNNKMFDYLASKGANLNHHGKTYKRFTITEEKDQIKKVSKITNVECFPTPLTAACRAGNVEIVKKLIEGGANINQNGYKECLKPIDFAERLKKDEIKNLLKR